MVLNFDLNVLPCEGASASVNTQVASAESSKGLFGSPIDVEEIDDEVELLSSSAAFPQVCSLLQLLILCILSLCSATTTVIFLNVSYVHICYLCCTDK